MPENRDIDDYSVIDSHCHLDFFDDDVDDVVNRARQAKVTKMVTISTRIREFAKIKAITTKYPEVFCSIGTHPHNATEESDIAVSEILDLAKYDKVIAIGESGLDYHYSDCPDRDTQIAVFRRHIDAARQTGLPLIIHARDADKDMITILQTEYAKGAFKAILHCFSSGQELAEIGVKLGFSISFSGIITFKNADEIRAIAKSIPNSNLLIETDAPYLAPVPYRGQRNEPAFVIKTAETLAQMKELSLEALLQCCNSNFARVFALK